MIPVPIFKNIWILYKDVSWRMLNFHLLQRCTRTTLHLYAADGILRIWASFTALFYDVDRRNYGNFFLLILFLVARLVLFWYYNLSIPRAAPAA